MPGWGLEISSMHTCPFSVVACYLEHWGALDNQHPKSKRRPRFLLFHALQVEPENSKLGDLDAETRQTVEKMMVGDVVAETEQAVEKMVAGVRLAQRLAQRLGRERACIIPADWLSLQPPGSPNFTSLFFCSALSACVGRNHCRRAVMSIT